MKLLNLSSLLTVLTILILSGCTVKPKPKEEAVIDSSLPKVVLTKTATKSSMKSIALEWKRINDKRVKGIYIFRESLDENLSQQDSYYETINNRFSTHFLDTNVKPSKRYNYYFVTYSDKAQGERSEVYQAATKPVLESVTWIYAANNMPRSAKIIWRPHTNKLVRAYEIQRKTLDETKWETVARVDGRLSAEYIDLDLKDSYTYQYNVRALTYNGITSKASEIVKSITKDLPLEITNIKASNNLAKKIIISWNKSNQEDFSHYNLYRSSEIDGGYELIAKLVNNRFEDVIEKDGAKYFYRVGAVDKDGLESIHDRHSVQGVSLSKPLPPAVVDASLINNKVILKWKKNDPRAVSYTVRKTYKKGLFDKVVDEFKDINNNTFQDLDISPKTTYYYQVISVDKNSIESEPSIEVIIETKDIK
ncbi:fibronectin type III domain-containing protein [Sulfurimonas lithotrophica]|uniref:Fibronectin type III domain-containing protein n=1 Tax=Sulfurimonas lithotrophica TaxID=2590022 RepID=A0A5P8P1T8_9BACT|nr:fibronectin type III domain-containing protein [Sulfurimonas lithotrophica]QFR49626.1 fibronectin type III domain-containing protein [Sulfurimonas lithotrophica]